MRSRSSMGESRSLVKPKCSRYSIEELSGDSSGGPAPAGRSAPACARRSVITWRCRYGSPPAPNTTWMADSPWLEVERMAARPSAPASRPSSGRVTSASTWVASSPGASVCTSTCGGAKSGNTSSRAFRSALTPNSAISSESAVTIFGCAIEPRTLAASMGSVVLFFRGREAADPLPRPQNTGPLHHDRVGGVESAHQPAVAHGREQLHRGRFVMVLAARVAAGVTVHVGAVLAVQQRHRRDQQAPDRRALEQHPYVRARSESCRRALDREQPGGALQLRIGSWQ